MGLYVWFVNALVALVIAYVTSSYFSGVAERNAAASETVTRKKRSKGKRKSARTEAAPATAASSASTVGDAQLTSESNPGYVRGDTSESHSSSEMSDSPELPVRGVKGWSRVETPDDDLDGNFWEECLWEDVSRKAPSRGGSSGEQGDWVDVGAKLGAKRRDPLSGSDGMARDVVPADGLTKKQRENRRRRTAKSEKQALLRSLMQY
jgi:hypothetical protein